MKNLNISRLTGAVKEVGSVKPVTRTAGKMFGSMLMVITALFLLGCGGASDEKAEEHEVLPPNIVEINSDQYKMAGIELGSVEMKSMNCLIKATGNITAPPQNVATICASYGGYVKSTSLLPGSPVRKGQVLATIENSEFITIEQDYLESQSRLQFLEEDIKRQESLYRENVNSAKNYQQALSEFKSVKSRVSALAQKLKLIGIEASQLNENNIRSAVPLVSPIDGFVTSVNVNLGKYVAPTDVLFEIVNNSGLTLEMEIFEKDAPLITDGMKIRFSTLSAPAEEMSATIYQSGKALDDDKAIQVYARIDETRQKLIPGMAVNALIETEPAMTTAVPSEAVVSFDDKDYIFIFKQQRKEGEKTINDFEVLEVRKGVTENGYTAIILPEHFDREKARIVVKGAFSVLAAMKNSGEMAC